MSLIFVFVFVFVYAGIRSEPHMDNYAQSTHRSKDGFQSSRIIT